MAILQYTESALKDLKKLERKVALRIVNKVKQESEKDDPLRGAKALRGVLAGFYWYRVGDYRVIFEIGEDNKITILTVLRIKHRKDVYK